MQRTLDNDHDIKPAPPGAAGRGASPAGPSERPVPPIVRRETSSPQRAEPRTRCPYCREEILTAARKCKHCGEYLDEQLRWQRSQPQTQKPQGQAPRISFGFSLPKGAKIGAVCALVALVGLGAYLLTRSGGREGKAADNRMSRAVSVGTEQANAGSGGGAGAASPSAGPDRVAAAMRKTLEGTEVRDSFGSVTRFPAPGQGDEPWSCSARDIPGKGPGAVIEIPYRLASMEPKKAPSGRGKLIVEMVRQSGGWALQAVFRQAFFLGSPGSETQVPEEDRQTIRLQDNDAAFARVKEAVQKAQAGS